MPEEPSSDHPTAEHVNVCRARFLALADRLQAVEEDARSELREVAAALGEPADYDAFLEDEIPGTPHHELYRCAESFELGAGARAALTNAAAATEESLLAEWERRRARARRRPAPGR